MCGIGGVFQALPSLEFLRQRALAMQSRLEHRGPDDRGFYCDALGHCALIHTRLSILDLSPAGHQPMSTDDGRYTIVFNGEIYNFQDLRENLIRCGVSFSSHSDTEVLLRLFQRHGASCLEQLQGMYAFAVWDARDQSCFLARDPLGIKPLYFWHVDGQLAFASEIRALLASDIGAKRLSSCGLAEYLLHGSVQEPNTLVEGIEQLPAGHSATWSIGTPSRAPAQTKFWGVDWSFDGVPLNEADSAVSTTRDALEHTIRRHLVSDVPVGIFLSGGIDSTALLALSRSQGQGNIRTFSIGFHEEAFDESETAARTAGHFGAEHHSWRMDATDGRQLLEEFLSRLDQPSNDGFNTFCVSKFARQHGMKVVLSGLGGDELFGGYPSFHRVPQLVAFGRYARFLGPGRAFFGSLGQQSMAPPRLRRLSSFLQTSMNPRAAYWAMRGFFSINEVGRLVRAYTDKEAVSEIYACLEEPIPPQPASTDVVSYLELTGYMRNQLLRDSDVMSMANGLELRVPFVDRTLIESLRRIPARLRHASGKKLLVDAVPEIPPWVIEQPKQGFRFPFDRWIQSQWGDLFASLEAWSPVTLGPWYRRWLLFTLNHFLRANQIESAAKLP